MQPKIYRYRDLRRMASRRQIDRAVASGELVRLRVGWYAAGLVDAELLAAVRAGGALSCAAALRRHGAWVAHPECHLRVPVSGARSHSGYRTHVTGSAVGSPIDDAETALAVAVTCLEREELVTVVDSLLNRRILPAEIVESILGRTGAGRAALRWIDAAADSGLESITRQRLRSRGLRLRSQVRIPGVGRVDLLVGARLVIELDGDRWHSDPATRERDRRRDSALVARGYLVLRFGYDRVMHDWDGLLGEVMAVVRRRDHRRPVHG